MIVNETKHNAEQTDELLLFLSNTILDLVLANNEILKSNRHLQNILHSYAQDNVLDKVYDDLKIYFKDNTTIHLHGYSLFRTKKYKDEINHFFLRLLKNMAVKKQYDDFIADMKSYVMENKSGEEKIYLKFINENYELYDENHEPITEDARLSYLCEFGIEEEKRTDFILHYLLKILPKKIILSHTNVSGNSNFLKTIQLVFGERVVCV